MVPALDAFDDLDSVGNQLTIGTALLRRAIPPGGHRTEDGAIPPSRPSCDSTWNHERGIGRAFTTVSCTYRDGKWPAVADQGTRIPD